jgi:membrane protease YdiL (CAAX protease family)
VWVFGPWQHGLRLSVALGLRPLSGQWLGVALGVGFLIGPLPGVLAVIISHRLGMAMRTDQLDFLVPQSEDETEGEKKSRKRMVLVGVGYPAGAIGMIVLAGVVVPFGEEALFRGVLHSWLRGGGSPQQSALAVFLSSMAFGLAHYRWDRVTVMVTFFFGIFLALLYDLSGSLWAPILVHALVNFPKIALVYLDRAGCFNWLTPAPSEVSDATT